MVDDKEPKFAMVPPIEERPLGPNYPVFEIPIDEETRHTIVLSDEKMQCFCCSKLPTIPV